MHSATWKTDIIIGTWRLLQLTAGATAYPAFSRPTWRFVENQMNAQKFIVNLPFAVALAAGIAIVDSDAGWQAARAQAIPHIQARVIATNIPGASAISQVGTFLLNAPPLAMCTATVAFPSPIPTSFALFIQPGAVLDPNRILVGSRSNFGAPIAIGVGTEGSFLSIDPSRAGILSVPRNFAPSKSIRARGWMAWRRQARYSHCSAGPGVSESRC